MKTAIYIEDGVVQLVITPETEFEKNALSTFQDRPLEAKIFSGSFYDCRGGWIRQQTWINPNDNVYSLHRDTNDKSLILKIGERITDEVQ